MGEWLKTWQRWVRPLIVAAVAIPLWLSFAGAEADGLIDNGSAARGRAVEAPAAVVVAEAADVADEPQPMRVGRRRAVAAAAPPTVEIALPADTEPREARRQPGGAAAAADPEVLPGASSDEPAPLGGRSRRRPGHQVRAADVPVEPAPEVAAAAEPTPEPAAAAPSSARSRGPQFVTDGSRADRGLDGTMAMMRDMPPERTRAYRRPIDPDNTRIVANYAEQIDVPAGQSAIIRLNRPAERVAIADPEVADVVLVNPREILINGRGRRHQAQTGETVIEEAQTSLVVWDKQGRSDIRELYVNRSRTEQVELRVTMAEFNRTALENQGYDFRVLQNKFFVSSQLAKLASTNQLNLNWLSPIADGPVTLQQGLGVSNDRVTFSVVDFNDNFAAFVEMLQREGLAKILARPSLLTRSGEEAHFKAGGEVPIPLVTNNQSAVQFKEFGAIVTFTPTFQSDGSIDLRVATELSEPDATVSGAVIGGFVVPGFRSRNTQTRVRLRDSQSLLIAGLLRDEESEDERKVPYLGDIPYLGTIFRNTNFIHKKTELVILVQPHVVSADRDDSDLTLPSGHGPFTRSDVRTRATPNGVTRPRINGPSEFHGTERQGDLPEPGTFDRDKF